MKSLFLVCLMVLAVNSTNAQTVVSEGDARPFIEINGTAEKEVIPDEIYITIVIKERLVNREKLTVETQENNLKTSLKTIGIDLINLAIADASADYVKITWQTKEVISRKEYLLKVSNATILAKVFEQLSALEINDAYVKRVSHSKLDSLKKEVRIAAIKSAKEKADYLLAAIGEQTGKALVVKEVNTSSYQNELNRNYAVNSKLSSTSNYVSDLLDINAKNEIEFQKIKITATLYTKFAIK
ncbi:MAG: SIMPL domain-containing protein [Bacteroidia bacterium]